MSRQTGIQGVIEVPGDKSISHRALLLAAIADGESRIRGLLRSDDTMCTLEMIRALGVQAVDVEPGEMRILGRGIHGLSEPGNVIDVGNSGTSIRVGSGLLAAQPFTSVITGDDSLRSRPMDRIVVPLRAMGAVVAGRSNGRLAPLIHLGGTLVGIRHESPIASAQVKSALLLAGLRASGPVTVLEPTPSRDHTERMLRAMGAAITSDGTEVTLLPGKGLDPLDILVPGDFSSAAFLLVLAAVLPGSHLRVQGVGVNPVRTGLIGVLARMGAVVELQDRRDEQGEPVADILVRGPAGLSATGVEAGQIPSLIDEIPVLCIAAALATGRTEIRGAGELRVKESDRIRTMTTALGALGVPCGEYPDGLWIEGPASIRKGIDCETGRDHRVAMSLMTLSAATGVPIRLSETSSISTSFPGFPGLLQSLRPLD